MAKWHDKVVASRISPSQLNRSSSDINTYISRISTAALLFCKLIPCSRHRTRGTTHRNEEWQQNIFDTRSRQACLGFGVAMKPINFITEKRWDQEWLTATCNTGQADVCAQMVAVNTCVTSWLLFQLGSTEDFISSDHGVTRITLWISVFECRNSHCLVQLQVFAPHRLLITHILGNFAGHWQLFSIKSHLYFFNNHDHKQRA